MTGELEQELLHVDADLGGDGAREHVDNALVEHLDAEENGNAVFAVLQEAGDHLDSLGGDFDVLLCDEALLDTNTVL